MYAYMCDSVLVCSCAHWPSAIVFLQRWRVRARRVRASGTLALTSGTLALTSG